MIIVSKSINLGPLESKLIFELEKQGKRIFDFQEAVEIVDTSDSSVANVLHRLRKKNRVEQIQKGNYVLNPARSGLDGLWMERMYLVVDHIVDDYYIGFWTAMNFWNMTEQVPMVTMVALTRRKRDVEYADQKIEFINIAESRFFGIIEKKMEDKTFFISSREKTLLDTLTYPQYCGGLSESTKAIWHSKEKLDWDRVLELIDRLDIGAVNRRLGYLLDLLEIKKDIRGELTKEFTGYRWLYPSSLKDNFSYSKKWGLKLNVSEKDLLGWRGH